MSCTMQQKHFKPVSVSGSRGAAALVTIVIVAVATLAMATTTARLGVAELETGRTASEGGEAFAVADGCMEETLRRVRIDTNHGVGNGTTTHTTSNGSCTINVSADGSARTIVITGTHGAYHATMQGELSLTGNVISITSWEEREQ